MELGVGMFGDLNINSKGEVQPTGQRLQEIIEEIKLMDETGLDFFGIDEHHRPDYASKVVIIFCCSCFTSFNSSNTLLNAISNIWSSILFYFN